MPKRKLQRRSLPTSDSKSSDDVSDLILQESMSEARKILQEGISTVENQSKGLLGLGALADALLLNLERCAKGEITLDQLSQSLKKIPNIFRPPQPVSHPRWLQPELAQQILDSIAGTDPDFVKRAEELSDWIKKSYPPPRGAEWRPENYLLGLEAQRVYDSLKTPKSWMKVAHLKCSQKGPGHTCTKLCADRLRQAADQSKNLAI